MSASAQLNSNDNDTLAAPSGCSIDPRREDAYWGESYAHEAFCRPDLSYEDYAPAFCVGYIGYSQYGGCYSDAETSLLANWLRIKGDSRLGLEEARLAMRAAWDRLALSSVAA